MVVQVVTGQWSQQAGEIRNKAQPENRGQVNREPVLPSLKYTLVSIAWFPMVRVTLADGILPQGVRVLWVFMP